MSSARSFLYLRDPIFLFGATLYVFNRVLLKPVFGSSSPFVANHLDDVFLIPVALPVLLLLQRLFRVRDHDLPPSRIEIVLWLALWSAFFEFLAPLFFHRGVADLRDVFAYGSGAVLAALSWRAFYQSTEAPNPEIRFESWREELGLAKQPATLPLLQAHRFPFAKSLRSKNRQP